MFGWSPVKAGALVIGVFVGNIAIKPATTPMLNRFGFRPVLLVATMHLAVTRVLCGLLTAGTPLAGHRGAGDRERRGALDRDDRVLDDRVQRRPARPDAGCEHPVGDRAACSASGLGIAAATVALRAGVPLGDCCPATKADAGTAYAVAFVVLAIVALGATVEAFRLHRTAGDALRRRAVGGRCSAPGRARPPVRSRGPTRVIERRD